MSEENEQPDSPSPFARFLGLVIIVVIAMILYYGLGLNETF